MSGIKSTSGATPTAPADTAKNTAASGPQVAAVTPATPSGGNSNSGVSHASSISALSEGTMLAAVVTARASGGDTMLHTEVGNFRMAARSSIPVGSHVVLEIEASDDLISARVIAINTEKLASPPSVTLLPIVNNVPAKPDLYALAALMATEEGGEGKMQNITATLGQLHKPGTGETLKVIMGPPPPQSLQANGTDRPALAATGNAGSALLAASLNAATTARSASSTAAAYAHTTAPGARATILPSQTDMAATARQQGIELIKATIDMLPINQRFVQSAGLSTLAAGNQLTLVASDKTAAATMNPELQKIVATGTVVSLSGPMGKSLGGGKYMQVHVQSSDLGSIRYLSSNPPAVGTQLTLALSDKLDKFPILDSFASKGTFKTPHLPLMNSWENLQNTFNLLAVHDPALASILLNSRIPTANTNLGASLLFFISALNGGNINKWLGQDAQLTLEKSGHGDLFKSLSDDFTVLSRLNSDAGGNDWKTLVFPFYSETRLQQLKMFYRKHSREGENGAEDETRFIIELDLSKSGAVQLDGLFKPKRFDLLFRHQQELDNPLKARVSEIFTENMEITGLSGSLAFRKDNSFPIHPTEEWEGQVNSSRDA